MFEAWSFSDYWCLDFEVSASAAAPAAFAQLNLRDSSVILFTL